MITAVALALALALAQTQAPSASAGPAPAPAAAVPSSAPRDSAIQTQARSIASGLRCPVCRGQSIQDSEAPLAGEMRELIREKLRNGESPQQIRQYFLSKYGEWILLQPEAHGFNLAVYVLPILGLLLGGAALFLAARRWTQAAAPIEAEEPTVPSGSDRS